MLKISINVGGRFFPTTKQTLNRSPFLRNLLESSKPYEQIFIDRDSEGFEHILRKLRDRNYKIPQEFLYELDFYGMNVQDEPIDEDVLPPYNYKRFSSFFTYINGGRNMRSWEKKFSKVRSVDVVMELPAEFISDTRSIFKVTRQHIDILLCVLYDFNGGNIKRGRMTIGGFTDAYVAEGARHFPTNIPVSAAAFQNDMSIVMEGRLEQLHVLVRVFTNSEDRRKWFEALSQSLYGSIENNLFLDKGELKPHVYPDTRPWYTKDLFDGDHPLDL